MFYDPVSEVIKHYFCCLKHWQACLDSRGGTVDPTFQLETGQGYTVEDHMRWPVSLWVLLGKYHLPNRILGHTLQIMCLIQDWRKLSSCLLSFLSIYSLAVASCPWLLLIFFAFPQLHVLYFLLVSQGSFIAFKSLWIINNKALFLFSLYEEWYSCSLQAFDDPDLHHLMTSLPTKDSESSISPSATSTDKALLS